MYRPSPAVEKKVWKNGLPKLCTAVVRYAVVRLYVLPEDVHTGSSSVAQPGHTRGDILHGMDGLVSYIQSSYNCVAHTR